MNDYILFKDINDNYLTLPEWIKPVEEEAKTEEDSAEESSVKDAPEEENADKEPKDDRSIIYYVTDVNQQGQYIKMFREQNMNAVILNHNIDTSFISQLERRNETYKFMRIDADLTDSLKEDGSEEELKGFTETLSEIFQKALNKEKLTIKAEKLKDETIASIITLSEEGRRMQDMMKMYSMGGMGMDASMFGADQTLTLNANHALVKYILDHKDSEYLPDFCEQLYDLAMLSNQPLSPDAMSKFVARSNKIMMLLTK